MSGHRRHSAEKGSHADSMGTSNSRTEGARLYLVTSPLGDAGAMANDLADALNFTDIAAVLVRFADADEAAVLAQTKTLRILVQSNGAALMLDGHPKLVARSEADGAHLMGAKALKG